MVANVSFEDGVPLIDKEQALRLPVRTGADVFSSKRISAKTKGRLLAVAGIFSRLNEIYQPEAYRACATSALREAENGSDVVAAMQSDCGLRVDMIDATTEAKLIYGALSAAKDRPDSDCTMHVDIGGGSTEIIFGDNANILHLESFATGTVRRQHSNCAKEEHRMWHWLETQIGRNRDYSVTASGGNARHLYKMCGANGFMKRAGILDIRDRLKELTVQQRIEQMGMAPDRADTILHAAEIYMAVLDCTGRQRLYVPTANLIGGILQELALKLAP